MRFSVFMALALRVEPFFETAQCRRLCGTAYSPTMQEIRGIKVPPVKEPIKIFLT